MDPKSIRLLAPVGLDSRIPEVSLCCALRAKRGLAFWRGGPVTLPRKREVRNRPELSQFQMKSCIGEAFLEAQAGFPDFLAQTEWPRLGIHSTPLCCALRAKRGLAFWQGGARSGGIVSWTPTPLNYSPLGAWTRGFLRLCPAALCEPSEALHSGKDAEGLGAQFHGPQFH